MNRKVVIENFQKEYIVYKIECNLTQKVYIGHTSNLTSRINTHISSFKSGNLSCTSSKILSSNDYKISVLRRGIYDKTEASKAELNFIIGYGSQFCVNKNKPCFLT
jgi:predicted GIY-YIG superfamily endonuclease